ncbi:AtpZ/AtpI family protein [Candidatus Bandiella numerosa]|uniref:AtpZ/AtpI family protein n=1 Tax=Candidatus Bandiella numerosa TaxID=2570586 RepID=UPI00249DA24C|nr:AtpZ/AtpI family protein [Candidatus Bandiella numerosa]WHA05458.1 AtpZ/AtpI family protein [Candidatus Bandiella numerosa]
MNKEELRLKLTSLEKKLNHNRYGKSKRFNMPMMIVTELFAGVLVGSAIGYLIDRYFKILPAFTMLFGVFGFFASLLNIYRNLYTKK